MVVHRNLEWLEEAVFYQIYPQSFYDANNDGIGDIQGIIEKLDYIESLGVNAIWLNPCFVSPFQDAGYDVADFYKVAPRYGTNRDLKRLFTKAHRRGIRICLDLVAGHTSIEHSWFKASCQHEPNEYSDRYIWTNSAWDGGDDSLRFVRGYAERDANFATNFFYSQPALNYGFAKPDPLKPWQQPLDAPGPLATRAELKKIMAFWLDMGADGFRVDMAGSLVKNDPKRKMTINLWREIREWLDEKFPEAVLISEWADPAQAISAGFHVDFMLPFANSGYRSLFFSQHSPACFFDTCGEGTITEFMEEFQGHYRKTGRGYISIPSGNHDMQRLNTNRSKRDLEVIFTFLMTWPGVPFIYYGDEIGMRFIRDLPSKEGGYGRTGSRTPMQWADARNAGFSKASPKKIYLPIDPRQNRPTVKEQDARPASLLNHVRGLTELRKSSPALTASGKMIPLFAEPNKCPFVFLRQKGREKYLVALNPSNRKCSVSVEIKGLKEARKQLGRGITVSNKSGRLKIDASEVSFGVFKIV